MAGKPKLDRKFIGVLYPDDKLVDYEAVLDVIQTYRKWAWIEHDSDVNEKTGEIKKAHIHFIVEQENPTTISAVAEKLGIEDNYLEYCKNFRSSFRYLIHADDPKKYQYDPESVQTNVSKSKYLNGISDTQKAQQIYDFIVSQECTSPSKAAKWAAETGNWSEFRRGFAIWSAIMKECERNRK